MNKSHVTETNPPERDLGLFEKYLTLWVILGIGAGILLGKAAPGAAQFLDSLAIYVGGAPVVSIPIALFFMMYPIMVKVDFTKVLKAGKNAKPVLLTLGVNWGIKPFTMFGISTLFLGLLFRGSPSGHGDREGWNASGALPLLHLRGHPFGKRAMYDHGPHVGVPGAREFGPRPGHGGHQLSRHAPSLWTAEEAPFRD